MGSMDTNREYGDHSLSGFYERTDDGYRVTEERLGTAQHLRVVMVGAGASGLNMARHMELHMENYDLRIYEKNADVGGTWFENRYPGCACDIPSHNYQFTWEPNTEWSHFYSSSQEILQYFKTIAEKYELYKYIKLNHFVQDATWNEQEGIWKIKVKNITTGSIVDEWGHIFINGCGILNNWKWPDITGLKSFKGALIHSAAWDDSYSLNGKNVAVLGCGSSGVQIVPTILPITEKQKQEFRENPDKYMEYRKSIESELNHRFKLVIMGSPEQEEARRYSINEMSTKLAHDQRLLKAMIPNFGVACRRPTPGNGYLEALTDAKVRVVTDLIDSVVAEGIRMTTGELISVDAFICATGFDISFSPRFKVTGRKNIVLSDQWAEKPEAYLSIAADNFPNYFMFLGPNSPVGHGSVLPIIEHNTKYIINFMKKIQTQNIKSVAPKPEAVRDFNIHTTEFMKRTAWATPCRSWFKNGTVDGPILALHPGGRIHWFHMLQDIRYEDWDFTYLSENRFQYLGNGFSTKELPGSDNAWYFEDPDEGYKPY